MQLRIVLVYSFIFTNINVCRAADSDAQDEQKLRRKVVVSEPSMKGDMITPLNVKSSNVPLFSAYDHQFTTYYKMTCGSLVTALTKVNGNARCMPEYNDIVVVDDEDDVATQDCLKIIICKPSKNDENVLCQPNTIRVVLPYMSKMLTHDSQKDTSGFRFKVSKGDIVFTNDPRCLMTFKREHKLRHRFQNKGDKLRKILENYPGFYLQPTFYTKRAPYRKGNAVTYGGDLHKGTKSLSHISCNAECDEGQLFYYKMPANVFIYSKIFVDGATCDWIKICTQGKDGFNQKTFTCDDVDLVNIYVRNGFVVMPGARNGAPIKFVKSTKGVNPTDNLSTRPTQIAFEYDGVRFAVWSVTREVVVSATNMGHDGHIIVYMSDHDCLIKNWGIKDMGLNNGIVHQVKVNIPIKGVNTGKKVYITYSTARSRTRPPTVREETQSPNFSAVASATTTRHMGIGVFGVEGHGLELLKGRKGWVIWMIFVGFFCGSFSALILAFICIYPSRRTYYGDWYRGMYKRYGVDPSNMKTAGITGSMFETGTSVVAPHSTIGPTTLGDTTGDLKRYDTSKGTYTYDTAGSRGSTSGASSSSGGSSSSPSGTYGSSRSTKHTSGRHTRGTTKHGTSRSSSRSKGSAFDSYVVAV